MASPSQTLPPPAAGKEAAAPKRLRDMIMTTTPVVLTVVATVLAGLSSSEMTQAQYHRALAAQNQAKATDQWGFFQSKRIRRMISEKTLDLFPDVPATYHPQELEAASARLTGQLERGSGAAGQLVAAVTAARADLGPAAQGLAKAAAQLQERAGAASGEAQATRAKLRKTLADKEVGQAFRYLETGRQPKAEEQRLNDPDIARAVRAVLNRAPDSELAGVIGALTPEQVRQAVDVTEANITAFERQGKQVDDRLGGVDRLVQQQQAAAHEFHRAAEDMSWALAGLPADKPTPAAVRRAADRVARADADVQRLRGAFNDYKAAREAYTARRNRGEGERNMRAAALYEIQVRQSSLRSETHQKRSKRFFFAMLCAQAGVALASLALMGHFRGPLWGVAVLAGLSAVVFGGQVYLGP